MFGALLLLACAGGSAETGTPSGGDDTAGPADTGSQVEPAPVLLGFPLPERTRYTTVLGVDHDPVVQDDTPLGRATCLDYAGRGFPHCYDEHDGTDYILDGGFDAMDSGSSPIVAAAAGIVSSTEDGHYDRCHADLELGDVSCDGEEMVANHVIVEHAGADGLAYRTLYWHMKKDSVAVAVGESVQEGTVLGLVGSSGYSSMPHLHLELQVQQGEEWVSLDPYAGPYSQALSYWCAQGAENALPEACGD